VILAKFPFYGRQDLVTVVRQMAPRSTARYTKHYTDGRLATQLPQAARGEVEGRAQYQGLERRCRGPQPYSTEGARGV